MNAKPVNINEDVSLSSIYQPSLFDFPKYSEDGLTTERVSEILNISPYELRQKCKIKSFLELERCVLLHKGRNRWRVLKTCW